MGTIWDGENEYSIEDGKFYIFGQQVTEEVFGATIVANGGWYDSDKKMAGVSAKPRPTDTILICSDGKTEWKVTTGNFPGKGHIMDEFLVTGDGYYINGELVTRELYYDSILRSRGIEDIVSPDAPITTNERGGSQSDVNVRFDLIDAKAMFAMAQVLDHGAKKYGANNWRNIDVDDHLNHLLMHTFAYLAGDDTDDHLTHILCRATFALVVKLAEQPQYADNQF